MKKLTLLYFSLIISVNITTAQNICIDSTFSKVFYRNDANLSTSLKIATNDNGVLFKIHKQNNALADVEYGIVKIDAVGEIEWTRFYFPIDSEQHFTLSNILQLESGEYIIGGYIFYDNNLISDKIILLKLNVNGDIIWQKQLNNNYGNFADETLWLTNIQEGSNGDIIVFSNDRSGFVNARNNVSRLSSTGHVIWSNLYFGKAFLIEPITNIQSNDYALDLWAITSNNSICFNGDKGLSHLQLDYNTGLINESKSFCVKAGELFVGLDNIYSWKSGKFNSSVVKKLKNGKTIVIIEDAVGNRNLLINLFDSNYNFIKSNLYQTEIPLGAGYLHPTFSFDVNEKNGEVVFNMSLLPYGSINNLPFQFYSFLDSNLNLKKQFFVQQNVVENIEVSASFLKNGEINFIGIFKQIINPIYNQIYYSNTLNGVTSDGFCNAKDSTFGSFVPHSLVYSGSSFQYDSIKSNVYTSADSNLFTITNFNILETTNCKILSICDSLKLTGPASVCLNKNDSITYSFYKNPQCLKGVFWSIDTAFATIRSSIKKSELSLKFKKEGRVILYLGLDGCHLKDSIIIDIKAPKTFINIIKDSLLCPGGKLTLNATKGFSSYQWQNITGTDSLIVNQPGLYKVTATDSCGNVFSDSIQINLIDTQFTLPPIAEICYNDTLTIPLPNSLINVNWQPIENVFRENNKLKFFPNLNTNYNLQAEFKNKCIVNKSFQLKVTNCPETVYFPNSFTPNNDGLNDIFKPIISKPLTQYYFAIYNRLGQKIFETNNQELGWDGNLKGIRQNTGSFIYICNYKFARKATQQKKGSFTLLR